MLHLWFQLLQGPFQRNRYQRLELSGCSLSAMDDKAQPSAQANGRFQLRLEAHDENIISSGKVLKVAQKLPVPLSALSQRTSPASEAAEVPEAMWRFMFRNKRKTVLGKGDTTPSAETQPASSSSAEVG